MIMQYERMGASEKYVTNCDEYPRVQRQIVATPLLEVSSVTVHSHDDTLFADGRPLKIYGFIEITDIYINAIDFFLRNQIDPEIVPLNGHLSLRVGPVLPYSNFQMHVFLRDVVRDIVIANKAFPLEYNSEDAYDNPQVVEIHGDRASATVRYTTFRSAAVAQLSVTLLRGGVFGRISASTEVGNGCSVTRLIFDKPDGESVMADPENPILCMPRLAVAMHSSLKIELDLSDCDTKLPIDAGKVLDFQVVDNVLGNRQEIVGNNFHIRVEVVWTHPYHNLCEGGDGECSEEDSENEEQKPKKHRVLASEQLASASCEGRKMSTESGKKLVAQRLVEVYSVFIGHYDCAENLHLHGTIKVSDKMGVYSIFERDEDNPLIMLPQTKMASIVWPACSFEGPLSTIELDLKDDQGRIISKGQVDWSTENVDEAYYNKRICSVIRGEHGYGTVHYAIFRAAMQATVSVILLSEYSKEVTFDVHGSLVSELGRYYAYFTYMDHNYYTSTLFEKPEEEYIEVACGSVLPQSKYEFAVPLGSSLFIEANLWIRVHGADNFEELVGSAELHIGSSHVIHGKKFQIKILVGGAGKVRDEMSIV